MTQIAVVLSTAISAPGHAEVPNDVFNAALVSSALKAPSSDDDLAVSNNAALYVLDISVPGAIVFSTSSVAAGGVDSYFSLISGTAGGAKFVVSNHESAFSQGGDFRLSVTLAPGAYTVAIDTYAIIPLPRTKTAVH